MATLYYGLVLEPAAGIHTMFIFNCGVVILIFSSPKERWLAWIIVGVLFAIMVWNYSHRLVPAVIHSKNDLLSYIIYPVIFLHMVIVFNLYAELHEKMLQLEMRKAELEKLDHIKNAFIAENSHELRSPIQIILTISEMLKAKVLGKAGILSAHELVSDLHVSVDHAKSIINNGLVFSKIEQGLPNPANNQPVNIRRFIADIRTIYQYYGKQRNIHIEFMVTTTFPNNILIDRAKLKQILGNLMENAIKYNREGCNIFVRVQEAGEKFKIMIEDQGVGMSEEQVARIFDLYATSNPGTGSGIGLYVTRNLVTLLGGTIQATSKSGKGTTFTLVFPLHPTFEEEEEAKYNEYFDGRGLRALVIEDDSFTQKYLCRFLETYLGFEVDIAGNGAKAVELNRTHDYAIIFLDAYLPDMRLAQVITALAKGGPHAPIVLTSGASKENIKEDLHPKEKILLDDIKGFLSKPYSFHEVSAFLNENVARQKNA
ncbi:hybrid sensor histidine kinase/response regulator [Chitinophaga varians]|uniref:hybrid sensor histidine kinase/response regulator n=1 Tax=Chitinophaga varians TaxID=2202339 RepID=UPI00165F5618|nr:hybrid sensor histidine kinase/response regulator [Chitinophaga varians]MBC9909913.1 hybrid sensor histidine kinase/response regulator [Chitinophaga varians]